MKTEDWLTLVAKVNFEAAYFTSGAVWIETAAVSKKSNQVGNTLYILSSYLIHHAQNWYKNIVL